MSGKALPLPSRLIQERTRQWFRKAKHELAFLEYAPFDLEDPPTGTAGVRTISGGRRTAVQIWNWPRGV